MNTIAKIIPENVKAGKISEVAPQYGLTVEEFRGAMYDWQQNEGFDGDGNEYETLHDWLTIPHNTRHDNTPYMKGDDNPV